MTTEEERIPAGQGLLAFIESQPKDVIPFSTNHTDEEYREMWFELCANLERDRSDYVKRQKELMAENLEKFKEIFPDHKFTP